MPEYIEREALLKRLNASPLITNYRIMRGSQLLIDGILDLVQKQPAADVAEVRHGYWIMHTNSDGNLNHYECSVCHIQQGHLSNYCEDCGAKMDGKGEGDV
jgi:hypothetical protein